MPESLDLVGQFERYWLRLACLGPSFIVLWADTPRARSSTYRNRLASGMAAEILRTFLRIFAANISRKGCGDYALHSFATRLAEFLLA